MMEQEMTDTGVCEVIDCYQMSIAFCSVYSKTWLKQ